MPVPTPGPEDGLIRVRACGICGTDLAVDATVDEFKVSDRVVVEAHMGCRRCENCIRGLYTAWSRRWPARSAAAARRRRDLLQAG